MSEDLRSHVAIGASLACQPELGFQVIASVLVYWQ